MSSAYPSQVFQGAITYVGDVLNPATRTMHLRLELTESRAQTQTGDVCLGPGLFRTGTRMCCSFPKAPCNAIANGTLSLCKRAESVFEITRCETGRAPMAETSQSARWIC